MISHRFEAATSREALRLVREQLGPDAMVLSSQVTARGVEVVAVVDSREEATGSSLGRGPAPTPTLPQRGREPAGLAIPNVPDPSSSLPLWGRAGVGAPQVAAPFLSHPLQETATGSSLGRGPALTPTLPQRGREPAGLAHPSSTLPPWGREPAGLAIPNVPDPSSSLPLWGRAGVGAPPSASAADSGVLQEIHALRGMIETQLAGLAWSEAERRDPLRGQLLRGLLAAGLSARLGRDLLAELPTGLSLAAGQDFLQAVLARRLPVPPSEDTLMREGGVYALVGPTGVGKTTTTAKLAARCVLRFGAERLALVTTDTYRMGAIEQLRLYGDILGVPTYAVQNAGELDGLLAQLQDKHMVLVDTVGMSQRDRAVAGQIALLAAPRRPVKRLLLLNAASHGDTLQDVVAAYQRRAPGPQGEGTGLAGCIFTKLDEAAHAGALIDTAITHQLAVHYLSHGQQVPEHLQLARNADLAASLFARQPAAWASFYSSGSCAWQGGVELEQPQQADRGVASLAAAPAPGVASPLASSPALRTATAQPEPPPWHSTSLLRSLSHDSAELASVAAALAGADAGFAATRQAWRQWADPQCPADTLVQALHAQVPTGARWQASEVLLALHSEGVPSAGGHTVWLSGRDGLPVAHQPASDSPQEAPPLRGKTVVQVWDQAPNAAQVQAGAGDDWLAYAAAAQRLQVGGQPMALSRWLKTGAEQGGPVYSRPEPLHYRRQDAWVSLGEAWVSLPGVTDEPLVQARCLVRRIVDAKGRPLQHQCALAGTGLTAPAQTLLQWAAWRANAQAYFKLQATALQQLAEWPAQAEAPQRGADPLAPTPAERVKRQWLAAQTALTVWHLQSAPAHAADAGWPVRRLLAQLAGRPQRGQLPVSGPTLLEGLGRFVLLLDALRDGQDGPQVDATSGHSDPVQDKRPGDAPVSPEFDCQDALGPPDVLQHRHPSAMAGTLRHG